MKNLFLALVVLVGLAGAQSNMWIATTHQNAAYGSYGHIYAYDVTDTSLSPLYTVDCPVSYVRGVGCDKDETSFYVFGADQSGSTFNVYKFADADGTVQGSPVQLSPITRSFTHGFAYRASSNHPTWNYFCGATWTTWRLILYYTTAGAYVSEFGINGSTFGNVIKGVTFIDNNYLQDHILYLAVTTSNQGIVYSFDIDDGNPPTPEIFAGPFSITEMPLDCTFYRDQNYGDFVYYLTESWGGSLWRIHEGSTQPEPLILTGIPSNEIPSGIEIDYAVYVGVGDTQTSPIPDQTLSVSENPFRSSTIISAETTGMLSIFDLSGRMISESEFHGSYTFEPRESGVYFVQITDGNSVSTARLVRL